MRLAVPVPGVLSLEVLVFGVLFGVGMIAVSFDGVASMAIAVDGGNDFDASVAAASSSWRESPIIEISRSSVMVMIWNACSGFGGTSLHITFMSLLSVRSPL